MKQGTDRGASAGGCSGKAGVSRMGNVPFGSGEWRSWRSRSCSDGSWRLGHGVAGRRGGQLEKGWTWPLLEGQGAQKKAPEAGGGARPLLSKALVPLQTCPPCPLQRMPVSQRARWSPGGGREACLLWPPQGRVCSEPPRCPGASFSTVAPVRVAGVPSHRERPWGWRDWSHGASSRSRAGGKLDGHGSFPWKNQTGCRGRDTATSQC